MVGRESQRKRKAVTPEEDPLTPESPEEDYSIKRQRNNVAVCKTRQKKRQEEHETSSRVDELRQENTALERKVEAMRSELKLLKEMIVAVAPNSKKQEEVKKK